MFEASDVRSIMSEAVELLRAIVNRRKTSEEVAYADLRPGDSVIPNASHPDEVGFVEMIETSFGRDRRDGLRLLCKVTLRYQDGHAGYVSAPLDTKIMRASK